MEQLRHSAYLSQSPSADDVPRVAHNDEREAAVQLLARDRTAELRRIVLYGRARRPRGLLTGAYPLQLECY